MSWTNYDYEKLSVSIEEATGVMLSVTTLKRVFGRVKYTSAPAVTTLNTLAQYVGYTDWQAFRQSVELPPATAEVTVAEPAPATGKRRNWYGWAAAVILILVVMVAWIRRPGAGKAAAMDTALYTFSSTKVLTSGVPNSVVFNYNAAAAGDDSVFIAQSWDIRRRKQVDKDKRAYSAIYYYPGFFRARLLIGDKEVKHHDLIINSDGWLALQAQEEVPVYFKKTEYLQDSLITVSSALLDAYKIPLQPTLPDIRIYNVLQLPGIMNNQFSFETAVKSDFSEGSAACQRMTVFLLCENDVIMVPLSAKGCVGDLTLVGGGTEVNSSNTDLSGFGCDLHQWTNLQVVATGKKIQFNVNGKLAGELNIQSPPSAIVGIQYRFDGPASVRKAVFSAGNKTYTLL
ncbi:hypothetical protein [Chitinophaga sp. Cy-1792]|uniref:hypothetical protein n=1 Tax=Chitinophaga sp. Cy-1792 TaxID=2608339 RepID=UPI00142219A7|nr:hypothetical protein [Chitinophaga sp. Cy-1792]NIG54759.1 hypothetical protein [Chitinophaga sp. Cy-1792]